RWRAQVARNPAQPTHRGGGEGGHPLIQQAAAGKLGKPLVTSLQDLTSGWRKTIGPGHSERSEESRHLWNQANAEILRRLRLLRMTASGVFQQPAKGRRYDCGRNRFHPTVGSSVLQL